MEGIKYMFAQLAKITVFIRGLSIVFTIAALLVLANLIVFASRFVPDLSSSVTSLVLIVVS